MKTYEITLQGKSRLIPAKLYTWENNDQFFVKCEFGGLYQIAKADDYFDALCELRNSLALEGFQPLCYGASRNFFPSAMSRQMSGGCFAYRMKLGKPALNEDLVCILESEPNIIPASVEEQRQFRDKWFDRSANK